MRLLKPGGRWVCVDWFASGGLPARLRESIIADIEKGMLLPPMKTVTDYINMFVEAGGRILFVDDISPHVAKTWE